MEHKKTFLDWLRRPTDAGTKQALENCEQHLARKSVLTATPSAGGYAVPEILLRDIEKFEQKFSPVRRLVRVEQIGSGDVRFLVNLRGATSGWAGESTTRDATKTPLIREIVPTGGELYAYPKASNWSLDDIFFNVSDWLAEEVGEAFAVAEGQAVISGDGSTKPTGMINTAPSSRDDFDSPIRADDVYQYVDDGDSPYAVGYDALVSLLYKVGTQYRANGTWVMNSATAAVVMKLKDLQNRPLWVDGLQAGQPTRLLGYPVEIWEDMPDVDVAPIAPTRLASATSAVPTVCSIVTMSASRWTPGDRDWLHQVLCSEACLRTPGRHQCGEVHQDGSVNDTPEAPALTATTESNPAVSGSRGRHSNRPDRRSCRSRPE